MSGLPSSVAASFTAATIDVPPGASNFRDVMLTLTPQPERRASALPFMVTATSITNPFVSGTGSATLTAAAAGVQVALSPSVGHGQRGFAMTVTNTGSATDTFTLALGGPAAVARRWARPR